MKIQPLLVLSMIVTLSTYGSIVHAEPQPTADKIRSLCEKGGTEAATCAGYIFGVTDEFEFINDSLISSHQKSMFCGPLGGLPHQPIGSDFIIYLTLHPEEVNVDARAIIMRAIMWAYPCSQ